MLKKKKKRKKPLPGLMIHQEVSRDLGYSHSYDLLQQKDTKQNQQHVWNVIYQESPSET